MLYAMSRCAIHSATAHSILLNEELLPTAAQKWCPGPHLNSHLLRTFHKGASQSFYTFNKQRFYSRNLFTLNHTKVNDTIPKTGGYSTNILLPPHSSEWPWLGPICIEGHLEWVLIKANNFLCWERSMQSASRSVWGREGLWACFLFRLWSFY